MKFWSVTLFVVMCVAPGGVRAQTNFQVSADALKGISEANEAYETIRDVTSIMREIEAGQRPDTSKYGSDWSALSQGYRNGADALRKASLPTDFDVRPYQVSAQDLANCYNKQANMNRLRGFEAQLAQAVSTGRSSIATLTAERKRAEEAAAAVRYLKTATADATRLPVLGELFVWDWYALEAGVSPALGEYRQALNEHVEKLERSVATADRQRNVLASNVQGLDQSICVFTGSYRMQSFGGRYDVLTFSGRPGAYSGVLERRKADGSLQRAHAVRNISFDGRQLSYGVVPASGSGLINHAGSISSDYRIITVTTGSTQFVYRR